MKRPTYTIASYIKKVFRPGERSLPRTDIIARLEEQLSLMPNGKSAEATLSEAMQLTDSPIKVGRTEAILELSYQPHQLFDQAYRFVRKSHSPKNLDQMMRELRQHTHFSWNQITKLLTLDKDPRFIQYDGDDRWYLAEWKLANDSIYEFLVSKAIDRLSIRLLFHMVENELKLSIKESIFAPELDGRFTVNGENIYVNGQDDTAIAIQEVEAAEAQVATTDTLVEKPALEQTEPQGKNLEPVQEEKIMITTQTKNVLTEVEQLLSKAASLLDQRNAEMSQEVISHFQESNMDAIEILMKEKHKNEQVVTDIKTIVTTLDQE
ncbi:hypothetical protein JNUCC42_22920 [Brevibacterium sp. JNUCC-42]|uniref:Uncharacterized protein n=1 Tax=Brevibacillus laterosporus TaxID=1465 RepID=A0A502IWL1_BRELA|nr:hypothetical protein [Brevibacillus laterosporus]QDX95548.1 hypothetical protein EEL30_26740 [Brevibacillus laterosporus]QOS99182.1 hypothetical protein JNUCC42_22920 [Brevibacterium sp. JNUCC-42]TPG91297.1 hypothetical protein EEL32_02785 [Brevibacillus laterosporus]